MIKAKILNNLDTLAITSVTKDSVEPEDPEDQWRDSQLYHQTRNLAILQERDRLARELHDSIAQALGYLNLQISYQPASGQRAG